MPVWFPDACWYWGRYARDITTQELPDWFRILQVSYSIHGLHSYDSCPSRKEATRIATWTSATYFFFLFPISSFLKICLASRHVFYEMHVSGLGWAVSVLHLISQKDFRNTKFVISLGLDQHPFFAAWPDYFGEESFKFQLAFIGYDLHFQLLENIWTTCLLAFCPSAGVV